MRNTGIRYNSKERMPTVLSEMAELLPPLSGEQLAVLEADLLANGCYAPVIVNEDMVIVDGHNRQKLCQQHGIPYEMAVFSFVDLLEAKQWALDTQKGRRNLDKWELGKIALKLKPDIEARARRNMSAGGGDQKSEDAKSGLATLPNPISPIDTRKELADMEMLRREIQTEVIQPALRELPPDEGTEILINPSGRFVLGGFEADTGLTGRKLMVDTYGGLAPHGGGALSGKDGSKVDRSGTYMARYIAKNIVAAGLAEKCTVSLAYAIGKAEPVAVDIDTHGSGEYGDDVLAQAVRQVFELTPAGMIRTLGLDKPIFAQFCNYGHFTHQDAPWEQCDRAELLWNVCRVKEAGVSSR